MSRDGFSCKELQVILDLSHPTKVAQAFNPALLKLARCWRVDPERTLLMILAEVRRQRDERTEGMESRHVQHQLPRV